MTTENTSYKLKNSTVTLTDELKGETDAFMKLYAQTYAEIYPNKEPQSPAIITSGYRDGTAQAAAMLSFVSGKGETFARNAYKDPVAKEVFDLILSNEGTRAERVAKAGEMLDAHPISEHQYNEKIDVRYSTLDAKVMAEMKKDQHEKGYHIFEEKGHAWDIKFLALSGKGPHVVTPDEVASPNPEKAMVADVKEIEKVDPLDYVFKNYSEEVAAMVSVALLITGKEGYDVLENHVNAELSHEAVSPTQNGHAAKSTTERAV